MHPNYNNPKQKGRVAMFIEKISGSGLAFNSLIRYKSVFRHIFSHVYDKFAVWLTCTPGYNFMEIIYRNRHEDDCHLGIRTTEKRPHFYIQFLNQDPSINGTMRPSVSLLSIVYGKDFLGGPELESITAGDIIRDRMYLFMNKYFLSEFEIKTLDDCKGFRCLNLTRINTWDLRSPTVFGGLLPASPDTMAYLSDIKKVVITKDKWVVSLDEEDFLNQRKPLDKHISLTFGNNIFDLNCSDQEIPGLVGLIDDPTQKNYVEELKRLHPYSLAKDSMVTPSPKMKRVPRYHIPIANRILVPMCYLFLWLVLAFILLYMSMTWRMKAQPMDDPGIPMSDMETNVFSFLSSTEKISLSSPSLVI